MDSLISELVPVMGMQRTGFIVSVQTEKDGLVTYGLFDSKEGAHSWAKHLIGAVSIAPVYEATWSRG